MPLIKTYFDKAKENIKNTLNQPLPNLPNPFNPQPPQLEPTPPKPKQEVETPTPSPEPTSQTELKEEVKETPKKQTGPSIPSIWKKTAPKLKNPWLAVIIFIILATTVNGYFLLGFNKKGNFLTDLAKAGTEKVLGTENKSSSQPQTNEALVAEVGSLFLLPNEEAEVATVTDVSKLRETEDFFDVAQNGDKLLVFKKAKKVVLYRPSEKKVVDSAPLLGDQSPNPSTSPLLPGN